MVKQLMKMAAVSVLMLGMLAGCGGKPDAPEAKYKIGFCMTLDHPYWYNMRLGAIDEGKKLGAVVTIMNAKEDALADIDQIGPTMAKSICEYFQNQADSVNQLLNFVNPQQEKIKRSNKLAGKTIVVTGSLETMTRQQAQQAIRQAGGKTVSSVSKKTDFVLAGKNAGSKLEKAQKLAVPVITEQQLTEMITE